ncbi:MAG: hypothetical protein FWE53_03340 [Firmicutes bacterium]|nr:hypothetical protein [Bacillota bacterium]
MDRKQKVRIETYERMIEKMEKLCAEGRPYVNTIILDSGREINIESNPHEAIESLKKQIEIVKKYGVRGD